MCDVRNGLISKYSGIFLRTSNHVPSMLKIGLTGGLGSGKSTVAHIFEVLGVPVYYADTASKRLMNEDVQVKTAVTNAFGDVYVNGLLKKDVLASIVFNDTEKL